MLACSHALTTAVSAHSGEACMAGMCLIVHPLSNPFTDLKPTWHTLLQMCSLEGITARLRVACLVLQSRCDSTRDI